MFSSSYVFSFNNGINPPSSSVLSEIKLSFNKKSNTIKEDIFVKNTSKHVSTIERGKALNSNKLKLRTTLNLKNIQDNNKEKWCSN